MTNRIWCKLTERRSSEGTEALASIKSHFSNPLRVREVVVMTNAD